MNTHIAETIQKSIDVKQKILADNNFIERIHEAAEAMVASLKNGGKIHFCGNGGSAADAQHLAAELSGRFYLDREPLNAEALHCNTSFITSVGNDYGFEDIYARMLKSAGKKGDVLVAISTSGNSENILRTCKVAKEMGIRIIAFTGETGGKIKEYSEILLNVPSTDTPRIQEAHIMIGHILCEMVEKVIFS